MIEVWVNKKTKEVLLLTPNSFNDWYYVRKMKTDKTLDPTLWIQGINHYWLLNNNWERK